MDVKKNLSKAYLANLNVNLIIADYIHCDNTWKEKRHIPDFNKIYYICDGDGWVETGNKRFFPKKGDLVIIPANQPHALSFVNDNYYKKYWCHFTATIGDKNLFDIFDFPNIINIIEDNDWIVKVFKKLVIYDRDEELSSVLKAKAALLQIISYFIDKIDVKELNMYKSSSIEKLEVLLMYIEKNLDQPITVEQLADIVHLQVNYFIKFFKLHLDNTPMNYVKRQRMEKAKNYLINSDLSISLIGQKVGYSEVSHFSNQFKNYTGITPSGYRKKRSEIYK
ncbi:MAG: AraC family transcriptional regulator [Vallitalea sp.]|jgi:AraC-like DNA-binding protein|nr:AraC family transcriptional regulator [Vallitalea sp.]